MLLLLEKVSPKSTSLNNGLSVKVESKRFGILFWRDLSRGMCSVISNTTSKMREPTFGIWTIVTLMMMGFSSNTSTCSWSWAPNQHSFHSVDSSQSYSQEQPGGLSASHHLGAAEAEPAAASSRSSREVAMRKTRKVSKWSKHELSKWYQFVDSYKGKRHVVSKCSQESYPMNLKSSTGSCWFSACKCFDAGIFTCNFVVLGLQWRCDTIGWSCCKRTILIHQSPDRN